MNKINGWKGLLGLTIFLLLFSGLLFLDKSGLSDYVFYILGVKFTADVVGGSAFVILAAFVAYHSRKLYKREQANE